MTPEQKNILESVFRENLNQLEVYAYRFLADWNDAHDAVQDSFCVACEKIDYLTQSENPIGWMKNVVKNVCRNKIRSRQSALRLLISFDEIERERVGAESNMELNEEDLFRSFEEVISKDDLKLLKMVILDGYSYIEASKEFKITMWACRKRAQRALAKLRKEYEK